VVDLVVSNRLLRATSEKKVVNFFEEKSASQTKSWLRLCPQQLCCERNLFFYRLAYLMQA